MGEIIPAILEKNWQEIERKINSVKTFAKTIQVDLIDGKFLPQQTFLDPQPFAKFSQEVFLELHLMVGNPIDYLESFARVGFKRFIAHVEPLPGLEDQERFVNEGKKFGQVGLAIDKDTDTNSIKVSLDDLDCLLVMLVKAGSSGQQFGPECLEKIKQLKAKTETAIEVDGGVNLDSTTRAKEVGATRFSVNSFLFNANNIEEQFNLLQAIAEK
jgi:ribulose-phosphate 3-epimerase